MQFKGFSRRTFLRGVAASGAMIRIGLPPLEAMTSSRQEGSSPASSSGSTATEFPRSIGSRAKPDRTTR